jgi:hypothetical protein
MQNAISLLPRAAIFLAGVAAGALTISRKGGGGGAATEELKTALANLGTRVDAQESALSERFTRIEARLEEHANKLAEAPTTAQIVAAMEQLLSKTMASLDERLTTQAHSIDILKSTVSQTDGLLERVLESLDSLQSFTDPSDLAGDPLLRRPAV